MNAHAGQERERLRPILFHPYTLGTVLYSIAIRLYGEQEVHTWEPETLALEFKDDFGEELPRINQDKINALIASVTSNGFYKDWSTFYMVSHILGNTEDPMNQADPLLVAQMCWAVIEVKLCDEARHQFSPEVAAMVGKLLDEEGFTKAPPPLAFAKMPEKYHGSDTPADMNKDNTLSTEHAKVAKEYVQEQSLLLLKQISALPWHTPASLEALTRELRGLEG